MSLTAAKYVFAVIGLVMLAYGLLGFRHTASFIHRAVKTQGTVTAMLRVVSTDVSNTNGSVSNPTTRYVYQPVVQFQLRNQRVEFTDSAASSPPAYHVGESVNVLYLESNPSDAKIESFLSLWLNPLLFSTGGTIFLVFGTGTLFRSRMAAARAG